MGDAYSQKIRLKHFQYRSPQQMQKRLETRREAVARGAFRHERPYIEKPWTARVADSSDLEYDTFDGRYVIDESRMLLIERGRAKKSFRLAGWSRSLIRSSLDSLRHLTGGQRP